MKKKSLAAMLMAGAMCLSLLASCASDPGSTGSAAPSQAPSQGTQESQPAGEPSQGSEPSATGASGTFKLGGIGPLTGENAIYGKAAMNGAQIAVDEINAMGGDVKLEFDPQDDVGDPETALNAYNNLLDDGMQVLVGTVTTGPAITVSAQARQDRVFAMTPSASSTDVTAGKDNMFQVCFTDPNQGTGSADYIAENLSGAKVAVIYRNDDAYSQGIRDTFVAEAGAKGISIVYQGTFTKDTQTDFSVQLNDAKNSSADLIYLPTYYDANALILTQANAMGYAPKYFGVDGMDGILSVKGFDTSLAEGVMLLTPFNADADDEATKSFVAKYQEKFGEVPNQFAADAYDCVYAIYQAATKTGVTADMSASDICDKLVEVFTSSDFVFDGLTGESIAWSDTGEATKEPKGMVIQNGAYVGME